MTLNGHFTLNSVFEPITNKEIGYCEMLTVFADALRSLQ